MNQVTEEKNIILTRIKSCFKEFDTPPKTFCHHHHFQVLIKSSEYYRKKNFYMYLGCWRYVCMSTYFNLVWFALKLDLWSTWGKSLEKTLFNVLGKLWDKCSFKRYFVYIVCGGMFVCVCAHICVLYILKILTRQEWQALQKFKAPSLNPQGILNVLAVMDDN